MEILKNFGVNPILLVAQVVNFLVILFILKKFLYKPILALFKKRQDAISLGLKQAEESRIKLEETIEKEKNILKTAQVQSKTIIDNAKKVALDLSGQINESTKKQTEKMIKDAQGQIVRESQEAEKRLALKVGDIAVSILQKSLQNFFSENQQKEIMTQVLKKIKGKTN